MRSLTETVLRIAGPGRKPVLLGIPVFAVAMGAVAPPPAQPAAPSVTRVHDGQRQLPIIAGSVAEPVRELQQRLKDVSGADFKVTNASRGFAGKATRKGGCRQAGQPPTHQELERLWAEDQVALQISNAPGPDSPAVKEAIQHLQGLAFVTVRPLNDSHGKRIGWSLAGTRLPDADFQKILPALTGSKQLSFNGFQFSNVVWKGLAKLDTLDELDFTSVRMTPEILKELSVLPRLQTLVLNATGITEAGVQSLAAFKQVRVLKLLFADVSDESLRQLGTALPKCKISRK